MVTVSVPIIASNIVTLHYPLDLVVYSVMGFADEVVLALNVQSTDDTLDYAYDLAYEINHIKKHLNTKVRIVETVWDLDNITSTGAEFAIQTNKAIAASHGDFIFLLQADEAIHEDDHAHLRTLIENSEKEDIDAYSMTRLYFYGDMNTIREDWTVPVTRLFKRGTRVSAGDAMHTDGSDKVKHIDIPIYHYSRIGDPIVISKRIRSLDGLFHDNDKLVPEEELVPYDFSTHNFDCMHKKEVDVGRHVVDAQFRRFLGTHPRPFRGYTGERGF